MDKISDDLFARLEQQEKDLAKWCKQYLRSGGRSRTTKKAVSQQKEKTK